MDGLTIAATIVQFIYVAGKVVSSTTSIRRSIGGQLDEHRELEEITSALAHDARKIRECIQQRRDAAELTDAEKEQEQIGQDCQDVAEQLLDALGKLKTRSGKKKAEKHKQSQWQSFRQALRILWREDEICALEKRLDRFRQQMVFIILGTLR
jgi:DNA topoisomerase VI subunit B